MSDDDKKSLMEQQTGTDLGGKTLQPEGTRSVAGDKDVRNNAELGAGPAQNMEGLRAGAVSSVTDGWLPVPADLGTVTPGTYEVRDPAANADPTRARLLAGMWMADNGEGDSDGDGVLSFRPTEYRKVEATGGAADLMGQQKGDEPRQDGAAATHVDSIVTEIKQAPDAAEAIRQAITGIGSRISQLADEGRGAVEAFAEQLSERAHEISDAIHTHVKAGGLALKAPAPGNKPQPQDGPDPTKEIPGIGTLHANNEVAAEIADRTGMDVQQANDKTAPGSNL